MIFFPFSDKVLLIIGEAMSSELKKPSEVLGSQVSKALKVNNQLLDFWKKQGFDLQRFDIPEETSIVLNPDPKFSMQYIAEIVKRSRVNSIVFVAGKGDIPGRGSDISEACKIYDSFLTNLWKATNARVLFAGLGFRENSAGDKGSDFFSKFADEKSWKLIKLSRNSIHILDLVTPPQGSAPYFVNGEAVPAYQGVVSSGIVHALRQLIRFDVKDPNNFLSFPK